MWLRAGGPCFRLLEKFTAKTLAIVGGGGGVVQVSFEIWKPKPDTRRELIG